MTLPLSLVIVTSVMAPVVAVTITGLAGLTFSAAGAGTTDSAAGVDVGTAATGAASAKSFGAASTWQPCTHRSDPLTMTPPSTASTANDAASHDPRARRIDVNE